VQLELTIETQDTGQTTVERLPIEDRVVLGRGPDSPVELDGPLISRDHIAFERSGDRLELVDLSSNGSWINGEQLKPGRRYPVTEIDRVRIPGYELRCVLLGAAPEKALAPAAAAPPVHALKSFLSSITATETTVAVVFVAAVAITAIFLEL
jgi:pSer/pThr/pTyr-binding forkhead associated (FHA) protein